MADFDESKHPRDDDGKFTSGGGASGEKKDGEKKLTLKKPELKFIYQFITRENGEYKEEELSPEEAQKRYTLKDYNLDPKTREELQGQPVFKEFLHPSYNGTRDGKVIIRYERGNKGITQEYFEAKEREEKNKPTQGGRFI